jgi:dephospho-CoA kinase
MGAKHIVVDADPAWAQEGLHLARLVRDGLRGVGADVDHIGSTAVPGLAAKDVIDLQALVCCLDDPAIVRALAAIGFRHRAETSADHPRPERGEIDPEDWRKLYFREPDGQRRIHLHVRRIGAPNATIALLLRDFLRADAPTRADWEALKRALSAHTSDFSTYAALKEPATGLLLRLARDWAAQTRWLPGASDVPQGD